MPEFRVGTSGWHYEDWRTRFYPEGLPKTKWLGFYSQTFSTLELNSSFYRLPTEKAFASWRDATPESFVFSVKASRFITHVKKLRDVGDGVANFLDRAGILKNKLGPVLFQLPPSLHRNDELLESFLSTLPPGHEYVFEFRHKSWHDDAVLESLRRYGANFCIFDMPGFSTPLAITGSLAYVRFHGTDSMYGSNYPDDILADWARRIRHFADGTGRVYVYFNNDIEAFAVHNAISLLRMLETS